MAWLFHDGVRPIGDIRMVFIAGSKNSIINTWVFPYAPTVDPVFAAELITMGGQPRLTFMDIQVPAMHSSKHGGIVAETSKVRAHYPDLRIDERPPEWAIDATAGQYLFTRQMPSAQIPLVCEAYCDLLDCYFDLIVKQVAEVDKREDAPGALEALHEYQTHHMHNSPGKKFLGKVFGESWTESFLDEFLFCLPGDVK